MVTVALTSEAREQLAELPGTIALRMEKLLTRLKQWPNVSGVKRLRGNLAGKCRLRTGDYRMQFHVEESKKPATETRIMRGKSVETKSEVITYVVVIEKIGHRDGFYED